MIVVGRRETRGGCKVRSFALEGLGEEEGEESGGTFCSFP